MKRITVFMLSMAIFSSAFLLPASATKYSDDEIALFNEHTNEAQTMIKAFEEWKTAADDRNEAYFDNYKEY